MKNFLILCAGFMILPLATVNAAKATFKPHDAEQVFALVKQAQEKICTEGYSFIVETIRSHEGKLCTDLKGAIAMGCEGASGFAKSGCRGVAVADLEKGGEDHMGAAKKRIADALNTNKNSVCDI